MSKTDKQITEFNFEGQVAYVFFDGSKPKYLQLMTSEGLHLIKLAKESRSACERLLVPGRQVQVSGIKKYDFKSGKIKLKAEQVMAVESEGQVSPKPCSSQKEGKKNCAGKAQILVCGKSDCRKRGGHHLCSALETVLKERGLEDQVTIKKTGCLKRCKAGPNLVMMPDKARYSRVRAQEVPELIAKHL
ncbi:MAG: (2Fe-2S) ferredoxin domain-containing protein [Cyanobacteriota bacterium]|nr:(2Fe-2S) ferredoxin domain-containing protein [Cyanobacteriota bacterium]